MVFRALIVLFSYGYNIEICKIIEATFLTLHFCHMRDFFAGQRGAWPNGKYASASYSHQKVTSYLISYFLQNCNYSLLYWPTIKSNALLF